MVGLLLLAGAAAGVGFPGAIVAAAAAARAAALFFFPFPAFLSSRCDAIISLKQCPTWDGSQVWWKRRKNEDCMSGSQTQRSILVSLYRTHYNSEPNLLASTFITQ